MENTPNELSSRKRFITSQLFIAIVILILLVAGSFYVAKDKVVTTDSTPANQSKKVIRTLNSNGK